MRHRLDGLHAAAFGETGHQPTEVCACPRDPGALPPHREHFGLYDNALFHTEVEALSWDGARSCWMVAPTVAMPSPPSSSASARSHCRPASPASRSFAGHALSPPAAGTMPILAAIPPARPSTSWPTSASASSALAPRPCNACLTSPGRLGHYTSSSAPSSVDVRANAPIDPGWFSGIATPGWQQRWLENFTANPGRRHGDRGSGAGTADRSLPPHPPAHPHAAQRNSGRARTCSPPSRMLITKDGRDPQTASTPSSRMRRRRKEAEGLVSPIVQAALLPRFLYLQAFNSLELISRRHGRQGCRAHHSGGRRRGRRRPSIR